MDIESVLQLPKHIIWYSDVILTKSYVFQCAKHSIQDTYASIRLIQKSDAKTLKQATY